MNIVEAIVKVRNDLKAFIIENLGGKVDKVDGMGLSSNDFTTAEKVKLAGLDANAKEITIDTALSTTSENPVQNKVVNEAINSVFGLIGDSSVSEQITNAINSIDYPVDSVNGKSGTVQLTLSDLGLNLPLGIADGGTGAKTARAADYNINGNMNTTDAAITDASQMVFKYITPDATKGTLLYRDAVLLWNYINSKVEDKYLSLSGGAMNGPLTLNKVVLSSDSYGDELPTSGTEGQLFFKLV